MKEPLVCFVHMERAGGTALHSWLDEALGGRYRVLRPRSFWSNEAMSALGPRELRLLVRLSPGLAGIGGHSLHPWVPLDDIERPLLWLTFLREPRSRLLSHYNHQVHQMGIPWSLDEFLREPRFHNLQVQRLSGNGSMDRAVTVLERMSFVGMSEEFDRSIERLAALLGVPGLRPPEVLNAAEPTGGDVTNLETLSPSQRRQMERATELDRMLYEHGRTMCKDRSTAPEAIRTGRAAGRLRRITSPVKQRAWSLTAETAAFLRWGATSVEMRDKFVHSRDPADR